jgi:hypothetical protein
MTITRVLLIRLRGSIGKPNKREPPRMWQAKSYIENDFGALAALVNVRLRSKAGNGRELNVC